MPNIHIVTDSCAYFPDPRWLQRFPVTVVPNKIEIAGKVYQEGIDLSPEEALQLIASVSIPPKVISPSTSDFVKVYNRIARDHDAILSVHASREMFASWHNARRAAQQLSGDCEIALVDSQTLCVGQGILVKHAAESLSTDEPFDALVRKVRGAVERIYGVYYVENVNFLIQNKFLAPSHGILSSMLGVKPFLAVEDGRLMPIEKVRTRSQAIERVAEFVVEFEEILEAVIIQPRLGLSETTRMLQDRLAVEFPDREFQHSLYAASLAALIGADANGFVLLEDEIGHLDHDTEED